MLPVTHDEATDQYLLLSPFYIPGQSKAINQKAGGVAVVVALCALMQALDYITLGVMPWSRIIGDGLGVPIQSSDPDAEESDIGKSR